MKKQILSGTFIWEDRNVNSIDTQDIVAKLLNPANGVKRNKQTWSKRKKYYH